MRNVICAAVMGVAMYFLYDAIGHIGLFLSLTITTVAGSAIYIGLMAATGGVTRADAQRLPFFGRFF